MNRHERRQKRKQFVEHVTEMHTEGQGVWELEFHTFAGALQLLAAATGGDRRALRTIRALDHSVAQMESAEPPVMCLTCDNRLVELPALFVMLRPRRDDYRYVVVNGICAECFSKYSRAALEARVMEIYKRDLITDMRRLPPISEPGHA